LTVSANISRMSRRTTDHDSFVVTRTYDASPQRTFAAWADPQAKARWLGVGQSDFDLDFRVGGRERHGGSAPDGRRYRFNGIYHDIVPDERIIYSYEMFVDDALISISVATVEFKPEGPGTTLVFTEQVVFIDGLETIESREGGMGGLLDALGDELDRPTNRRVLPTGE
jgi:uncharacterized protein YndB with AHSA1/START domain